MPGLDHVPSPGGARPQSGAVCPGVKEHAGGGQAGPGHEVRGGDREEVSRFGRNQTLFDFGLEAGGEEDRERVSVGDLKCWGGSSTSWF